MPDQFPDEESLRTKAKVQGWTPEAVINDIESADFIDSGFVQWCRTVKDDLYPALMQIMQERRGTARLRASLLLLHLGEPEGTDGVIACLQEDDPEFRIRVLSALSVMPLEPIKSDVESWYRQVVPLKKEALFAQLEPLLTMPVDAASMSLEARTQHIAVDVCLRLHLPEVEHRILPFLENGPARTRSRILHYLAWKGEDRGALKAAKELLREDAEIHSAVGSLEVYCKGEDVKLSKQAADMLVDFVKANLDRPGNYVTNHLWHALDGIVAAKHPKREKLLKDVLMGPVADWRRGVALRHLATLEGEAGIARLREALADPLLRQFAAQGIAENARGRSDAGLVDALVRAVHAEKRGEVLYYLIDALITIDTDVKVLLERDVIERLKPSDVMRIYWLANQITLDTAVEHLVAAEVIAMPDETELEKLEDEWEQKRDAYGIIISLLSEHLIWFDTESSRVIPDYLNLISQFLDVSRDVFNAEAFSHIVDKETSESTIRFHYNGRDYEFMAEYYGDWYDVRSVIEGLNRSLMDSGQPKRFVSLYTGDQTAAIVFVPEKVFRQVAETLHIPLQDNVEAAMQQGITFEKRVIEEVKRQGERDRQSRQRVSTGQRLLRWLRGMTGGR